MTTTTMSAIIHHVAAEYRVSPAALAGPSRKRTTARPRQVVMFLARKFTTRSYPEIGLRLGNRDHTTIMHGAATIARLLVEDLDLRESVERIEGVLPMAFEPAATLSFAETAP